jgi:hypothetical protein
MLAKNLVDEGIFNIFEKQRQKFNVVASHHLRSEGAASRFIWL